VLSCHAPDPRVCVFIINAAQVSDLLLMSQRRLTITVVARATLCALSAYQLTVEQSVRPSLGRFNASRAKNAISCQKVYRLPCPNIATRALVLPRPRLLLLRLIVKFRHAEGECIWQFMKCDINIIFIR
jgi:hypothetical protein